jgi:hypothetical protein
MIDLYQYENLYVSFKWVSKLFISHVFHTCKWPWVCFCIIFSCILIINDRMFSRLIWKKNTWLCQNLIVFEKLNRACFSKLHLKSYYYCTYTKCGLFVPYTMKNFQFRVHSFAYKISIVYPRRTFWNWCGNPLQIKWIYLFMGFSYL